jgi:hypothetical protein
MFKNAQNLGPRVPSGAWVTHRTHENGAENPVFANPSSFLAAEDPLCPGSFASLAPGSLPLTWCPLGPLQGQVLLGTVGAFNWSGGALLYSTQNGRGCFLNQTAKEDSRTVQYSYLGKGRVDAGGTRVGPGGGKEKGALGQ